jgi:hypothetical protein
VPASPLCGFQRFLQLLASFDWQQHALLVDPSATLSPEVTVATLSAFEKRRTAASTAACCVITPYDLEGEMWTSTQPTREMLPRARALASSSFATLSGRLLQAEFVSRCAWVGHLTHVHDLRQGCDGEDRHRPLHCKAPCAGHHSAVISDPSGSQVLVNQPKKSQS